MSAPGTNTKKQAKRHWPLLGAILLSVAFGVGIIVYWSGEAILTAPEPDRDADEVTVQDIRRGDVDVPAEAPVRGLDPVDVQPPESSGQAPVSD